MANAFFTPPIAENEPVLGYAPGSAEKEELQAAIAELKSQQIDAPMIIGGKEVRTGNTAASYATIFCSRSWLTLNFRSTTFYL